MQTIKKIIITISKLKKDFPALISYETEKGIQTSFNLDKTTNENANRILKIVKENYILANKNSHIYCYDYSNNKINIINSLDETNNYYLVGSNLEGIEDLIYIIKRNMNKRNVLIPIDVIINNKTFHLNEEIIKKKKGIQDIQTIDLEEYLLFLNEFHSN